MWVLQSAPGAKYGFGRYSGASLNPLPRGRRASQTVYHPASGQPQHVALPAVPRGFWQSFISGCKAPRKAGRKLETKRSTKKIGGWPPVKPSDFYSLLFLFYSYLFLLGGSGWCLLTVLGSLYGLGIGGSPCWIPGLKTWLSEGGGPKNQIEMLGNSKRKPESSNMAGLRDLAPKTAVKPSLLCHIPELVPGENFWGLANKWRHFSATKKLSFECGKPNPLAALTAHGMFGRWKRSEAGQGASDAA